MDELKPCPWCKSDDVIVEFGYVDGEEKQMYGGRCRGCWSSSPLAKTSKKATVAWNTRPIEDALRAENERLTRQNDKLLKEKGATFSICEKCGEPRDSRPCVTCENAELRAENVAMDKRICE